MNQGDEELRDRASILREQIENSGGLKAQREIITLQVSYFVFDRNHDEVRRFLERAQQSDVAFAIWDQNQPSRLSVFAQEAVRLLHNYVAGSQSFVERTSKAYSWEGG